MLNYRERHNNEEVLLAAKIKVARDTERETEESLEEQRKYEEQQRDLLHRVRRLEVKETANNLKVRHSLHTPFY